MDTGKECCLNDCCKGYTGGGGNRCKGVITVEASVLIPIILFLTAGAILLFLTIGHREQLRGDMYKSLYSLTIMEERDGRADVALEDRIANASQQVKDAGMESLLIGEQIYLHASVSFLKNIAGLFSPYRAEFPVTVGHEKDLCSDRLRRWQLYGNFTTGEGD